MKRTTATLVLCALSCCAVTAQRQLDITVKNPLKAARAAQPVVVSLAPYGTDIHQAIVKRDGTEIASQLDDLNGDGQYDELCFIAAVDGKSTATYTVDLLNSGTPRAYQPQVYADMMLSNKKIKESNKQNLYIRSLTVENGTNPYNQLHHHGPAFESELTAYRIYFDHRQTVDIYGKCRKGLELKETQFYPDRQQKADGYGDDVLWVGNTFGLGTLRGWDGQQPRMLTDVARRTERIVSSGPVRTVVEVVDDGWKDDTEKANAFHPYPITMTLRYTLYAGRRDCQVDVAFRQTVKDHQFATGLINVKDSKEYSDHEGLRGCWGTDWPVSAKDSVGHKRETVGLGICLPPAHIVSELPANKDNYPFVIGRIDKAMRYHITFCSDNETFGYHSAEAWFDSLKAWKQDLTHPVVVTVRERQKKSE